MHIGVFAFLTDRSNSPAVLAKRAEELGFESFWVPEHSVIPVTAMTRYAGAADGAIPESYGRLADPFVALAMASGATQTIKLGTGICLVPERNPLLLAKEVATLDHFSGGRFIFGIGAGWLREESEIMGCDFPHRWTHTREAVMAMKELWTQDEAEYHGTYFDFPPVRSFPKPAQKPHPPILLGGTAPNVFKRVVEWADGWMPTRASTDSIRRGRETLNRLAEEAGRDPDSIETMAFGFSGQYQDRKSIEELEDAGVSRVTLWMENTEGEAALANLESLAAEML